MRTAATQHQMQPNTTYLAVIHTSSPLVFMHSAAQPWAVVSYNSATNTVKCVHSRHATKQGACIACGKRNAANNKAAANAYTCSSACSCAHTHGQPVGHAHNHATCCYIQQQAVAAMQWARLCKAWFSTPTQ